MSTPRNDGGPAFPLENPRMLENGELFKQHVGLTKREWYAGMAMQAIISGFTLEARALLLSGGRTDEQIDRLLARSAFQMADYMIAAGGGEP